ncbi:MAG: hypothetical protein L3J47_05660 [Sulfurovum sp.]|nr:hypothetical protein [Sulfurovum sp.]
MPKILQWLVLLLGLIIVAVAIAGMYKFNYLSSQEGYDVDGNKFHKEERGVK